jgi:hypothetical protein
MAPIVLIGYDSRDRSETLSTSRMHQPEILRLTVEVTVVAREARDLDYQDRISYPISKSKEKDMARGAKPRRRDDTGEARWRSELFEG